MENVLFHILNQTYILDVLNIQNIRDDRTLRQLVSSPLSSHAVFRCEKQEHLAAFQLIRWINVSSSNPDSKAENCSVLYGMSLLLFLFRVAFPWRNASCLCAPRSLQDRPSSELPRISPRTSDLNVADQMYNLQSKKRTTVQMLSTLLFGTEDTNLLNFLPTTVLNLSIYYM